jgi:hypothetical protein
MTEPALNMCYCDEDLLTLPLWCRTTIKPASLLQPSLQTPCNHPGGIWSTTHHYGQAQMHSIDPLSQAHRLSTDVQQPDQGSASLQKLVGAVNNWLGACISRKHLDG